MRVLHLGRFYNSNFGGLERYVALLIEALRGKVESDNLVASDTWAAQVLDLGYYKVYKVPSLGLLGGMAVAPAMPLWARRLHRQHPYDIVHLHFPDPLSHLVWYAMPPGPKLVISWHSDVVRQKRWMFAYQSFIDHIVRRADAIVAATPYHFSSSTQLDAFRDESRKYVIPYGIDLRPYAPTADSARKAAEIRARHPGKRLIFAIGRHVYYKGFEYLIRAMSRIPNAVAVIGGNGPLTGMYKELAAELNLGERVDLVGRIDDADLPAYYQAADLFCLSSVSVAEAFGIVQIEAMASRKAIVCCQLHNGVNYVNVDNVTGLTAPPRDPEALAQAINRLLDDDALRERMGAAGFARVQEHFSLEQMGRATLDMYQRVLGNRTR